MRRLPPIPGAVPTSKPATRRAACSAGAASSLPAGLFHGTVHADDGPYARLFRAAALFAARCYAVGAAGSPGGPIGLLRKADGDAGPSTAAWPEGFVRRLDATEASRLSGAVIDSDAWFYPGGGWIGGAEAVRRLLEPSGVTVLTGVQVAALSRSKPQNAWRAEDAAGHTLAEADIAVLANGAAAPPLLAALGHPPWPLHTRRGQLTHWLPQRAQGLQLPVAGDGYAVPMPGGTLLCGATRQEADDDPQVRHADHADNLRRLRRLTGIGPSTGDALQGWVGFRLHSDDRLPIAGAMPLAVLAATQRLDQARWLPREPGLFVLCALGARGLTLAPLLGELVAAQATGTPWPLEQDLADAVDPGRWRVRAARRGSSAGA
jgi:tRNA 5-methylaminomethyl-2-thiouridine biosynthesis bifunctional protein